MNNIITSIITDPSKQQPFTGPSLNFLQNATKEAVKGIVYGMLGENLYAYVANGFGGVIVSGCTKSGSGNTLFNGFIWYADELFFLPGGMGLNSFTNPPRVIIDETNDASIDPVEFSDNTMNSVHKVRRLRVVDQASGGFLLSATGRIIGEQTFIATAHTNTTTNAELIPASSIVTPNRICDLEISVSARMSFTANGAAQTGGILRLQNTTVFAIKTQTEAAVGATVPNGQFFAFPVTIKYVYKNIPANTTLDLTMQSDNIGSPMPTLDNCYITYREVIKPKLW